MPGQISRRLGEFSAYYANRVSYEEVEGLIERLTGERLLSDQTIWSQVVEWAVAISQQWSEETATLDPIETASQVDWYDSRAHEALVLSDAIQVKLQKPRRYRSGLVSPGKALGILKVVELNGQWDQLWFPE